MNRSSDHATVPAARTSFLGRRRERDHLGALVREGALATLTGVGGAGKTRLAAEVAADASGEVCWCELAALTDDAEVAPAVAAALGRDDAGDAAAAVVEALSCAEVLLVLDNCEQVLAGAAALVDRIASRVPAARLLATSRQALGVEGEHVIALGPLALPPDGGGLDSSAASEAVALFVDRARLVRWDFELTAENAAAVARVCRRLDGLPLAIELAAARAGSLAPAELADRLDRRFDMLARLRAHGSERHRTLRAAIDWSYRLLDERERLVFERLSVVASRCDLEAAGAICGGDGAEPDAVAGLLDGLVERSLVRASEQGGRMRYGMLETLREYARERLRERGDEERLRDRHADWFALVADRAAEEIHARWAPTLLHEGVATFPEIRAACGWAIRTDGSPQRAARLLAPLWALAHSRHAREIGVLCEEALEAWPEQGGDARQTILGVAATAHFVAGDAAAARLRAGDAVLAQEPGAAPALLALRALALVSYVFDGDPKETLTRLDDVVDTAREHGVATIAAEMSVLAAQALAASGDAREAVRLAETLRAEAERAGSPMMEAWSVYVLGTVLVAQDGERAQACFEDGLELARAGGYSMVAGNSLRQLGRLAARGGRSQEAAALLAEGIARFAELDDRPQLWDALRSAAPLLARQGRRETAAEILAGAAADPFARAVPPLEADEIAALHAELEAELAAGRPGRLPGLVPRVLEELGAIEGEPAAASAPPATTQAPPAAANAFRREGELWTLSFEGRAVHLPDLKGLHDLARMLAAPEQELHCLELAGAPRGAGAEGAAAEGLAAEGHAGELLDDEARAAYKRRLDELREELELARAANDTVRAERAREESDALTDALASAFGLGGRPRKAGEPAERARSAVTWRVRSALSRIEAAHPELGRHLRNSVRTGIYCVYRPERPTDWLL